MHYCPIPFQFWFFCVGSYCHHLPPGQTKCCLIPRVFLKPRRFPYISTKFFPLKPRAKLDPIWGSHKLPEPFAWSCGGNRAARCLSRSLDRPGMADEDSGSKMGATTVFDAQVYLRIDAERCLGSAIFAAQQRIKWSPNPNMVLIFGLHRDVLTTICHLYTIRGTCGSQVFPGEACSSSWCVGINLSLCSLWNDSPRNRGGLIHWGCSRVKTCGLCRLDTWGIFPVCLRDNCQRN